MLGAMGLAAAGTVAIAVLVALTLLPALLGIAGRRVVGSANHASPGAASSDGQAQLGRRSFARLGRPVATPRATPGRSPWVRRGPGSWSASAYRC